MLLRAGISACRMRGSTAGIDDNLKGTSEAHFLFLSVLDSAISSLLIAPAVIAYWRGTWLLFDRYLYPDSPDWSSLVSFLIGVTGHMFFSLAQAPMTRSLHPEKHRILYYLTSRTYSYAYGVVCVNMWRGVWKALGLYSSEEPLVVGGLTLAATVALMGMRTLRNVSATPFAVVLDICQGYFDVPTMFKINGALEMTLYVMDCIFSVFVIGSLVVFVWRGAWTLLDLFLFPEDNSWSAFSSLIIGYGVVLVTFAMQPPMKRMCEWLTGFWRIVALDTYVLLAFCGTINLWRGFWMLLDLYFLPDAPLWSYLITHIFPFILLVLLNCSNSLLVRGVFIDGEESGGKCVDFPTYYLRMFFQEQRKKKLLKQSQRMMISTLANKADEMEKSDKSVGKDSGRSHVIVDVPHVTRF